MTQLFYQEKHICCRLVAVRMITETQVEAVCMSSPYHTPALEQQLLSIIYR